MQVPEDEIEAVTALPALSSLPSTNGNVHALLQQTAVLKLNGGLGTSMGLEKAKSLLEVRYTFTGPSRGAVVSGRAHASAHGRIIIAQQHSSCTGVHRLKMERRFWT